MEDNKLDSFDLIDIMPLDDSTNKLAQDIINESDGEAVQKLVKIFNLNQAKKNVIRVLKYNALADKLADEALNRVTKHSNELATNDLLSFIQVANAAIDRANKSLSLVDETPAIQINQVNNINVEEPLDRESRAKIRDAVNMILAKSKEINVIKDTDIAQEVIEIEPELPINTADENTVYNNKLINEEDEENVN